MGYYAVVFVEDLENTDVCGIGSRIENHPLFPQKTNVNFVQPIDSETIAVRTLGRGSRQHAGMRHRKPCRRRCVRVSWQTGKR